MTKIDYLEQLRQIAENNGGQLISDIWIDNISKYTFKHHTGKVFEAFAYVIKKNGWPKVLHKYKSDEFRMEEMKKNSKR